MLAAAGALAPARAPRFAAADVKLPGWSAQQVARAVASLQKFVGESGQGSMDLLADDDEVFYLQLALKAMPLRSRNDKPVPLPLPHPLASPEGAAICLFVKDHAGEGHKAAKAMVGRFERRGGVAKVLGLSKLRTKYESHEAKRELCKLYDLFLADERILPSLPKLIGKSFFKKKRQPIPVDCRAKDFPAQVRKACSATHLFKSGGTCVNIRVARSSQTQQQVADNIHAVMCQAVEHVPKKWSGLQGVFLKTASSVALPLFQALPDAKLRIDTSSSAAAVAPSSSPASGGKSSSSSSSSSKKQRATAGAQQQLLQHTPGAAASTLKAAAAAPRPAKSSSKSKAGRKAR